MPRASHPLPQLVLDRLRAALARLRAEAPWVRARRELAVEAAPVRAIAEAPDAAAALRLAYEPLPPGSRFGAGHRAWQQRWCRVRVPAGRSRAGAERLLEWRCQGETTAWIDGEPWCGLDDLHPQMPLPDGERTVYLDVGLYPSSGMWVQRPIDRFGAVFDGCALVLRDRRLWQAQYALEVVEQLLRGRLRAQGLEPPAVGFHPPFERLDPLTRQLVALAEALCALAEGGIEALAREAAALLARMPAEPWQPRAVLVGHAHLDVVWLWPEAVAERKALHSWATMLRLAERWPELVCQTSQPALLAAAERRAPALAARIRRLARAGRWELSGAFFVECDTHLPCGEALVRCLRLGQRRFAAATGAPSRLCWLPDAFGYSAALPQILAQSGVDRFFTTKLAWSAITRFPHTSFVWRGHDGSEVLAHIAASPAGYNGHATVGELVEAAALHRQLPEHPELLCPTGHGDGGGGVAEDQLARARCLASLAGVPRVIWDRPAAFFDRLEALRDRLPVWQGELYLEYHRGTFTTQARCKAAYRALERALQTAEAVRAVRRAGPLPDEDWERLSLAQFHDALPGSSIGLVYEQLVPELERRAEALLERAAAELRVEEGDGAWSAFNPLALARQAVVEVPALLRAAEDGEGRPLPVQRAGARTLVAVELPALGGAVIRPARRSFRPAGALCASPGTLDNGLVHAAFDERGRLSALTVDGEALALAAPAGLALYRDLPADFDAWDIDRADVLAPIGEHPALALRVEERGPLRATLAGSAALGERSRLTLRWRLELGCPWLLAELDIEWRERHRLLKFHCPTAYRGRLAWFGAPFGAVGRVQQPADAAAAAQWEVPASRWAAVTDDDGQGLALVSERSYGFACRDGDLALSLLRAPTYPDAEADQGRHRIRWALGRHRAVGVAGRPCTAAWADLLYTPPLVVAGRLALPPPPVAADAEGSLVPAWVEPLAGGGCALRLHETAGRHGAARLQLGEPAATMQLVELSGRPLPQPCSPAADGAVLVRHTPYQLLTLVAGARGDSPATPRRSDRR